ncbi:MAG: wall-associated protein, partial [Oxalobacteraceae bacterium]
MLAVTLITPQTLASVVNAYTYNRRRLMTGESVSQPGWYTWGLGYGYDAGGNLATQSYPTGLVVSYSPNALGQSTQVTSPSQNYATGITYFPNGALKQFTYGNGIVHTLTQNARKLPSQSVDGTVLNLTTTFDGNGNATAITDGTVGGRQTRSMGYDGLDRLTSTTSPMFGTASYVYDTLDNLTQVHVSSRAVPHDHLYYCYSSGGNRLDFVRSGPICTGSASPSVIALGYDAQGNLAYKNAANFSFDYGNRARYAGPDGEGYRYDAEGRRVVSWLATGTILSHYSKSGQMLYQENIRTAIATENVYLAGSLLATRERPFASPTAPVSYLHTDALGTPIAKTNSGGTVIETSEYEPYGDLLNRANDDRVGYTGHVMDAASGLTYMQQRYYDPQIGRF